MQAANSATSVLVVWLLRSFSWGLLSGKQICTIAQLAQHDIEHCRREDNVTTYVKALE
jgi:hypothetical protein